MTRYIQLALLVLLSGCSFVFSPGSESVTILLKEGETYTFDNGDELTVTGSVQDSRCPADAICIWEGEALVYLQLNHDSDSKSFILTTHPSSPTKEAKTDVHFWQYRIALLQVDPYPGVSEVPQEYSVQLRVRY